jgi:DNA primase
VNLHQPLVHCFAGCGISGTWENAIAQIEGVTHRQARKSIFKHSRVGGTSVHRRVRKKREAVQEIDVSYMRYLPNAALGYLKVRGISDEIVARYELGWDADSMRIVIPVKDSRGRVKLLIKRTIKPHVEPRYLYTEGIERNSLLFGLDTIDPGMVKSYGLVLVEGSLDKMVISQFDVPPSLAILGSKVSEIQAQLVANMRPPVVYTMFDADAAGIGATISAAYRIRGVPIKVCRYPKGKTDPAVLTSKEASRSIEKAIAYAQFSRLAGISPRSAKRKESVG